MKKHYSKGEIASIILKVLFIAGVVVMVAGAPNTAQLLKYIHPRNAHERGRVRRAFSRLENRGFVTKHRAAKGERWKMTDLGKRKAMLVELASARINRQNIWDGRWRLILFDIAEEKKNIRKALSGTLKRLGCGQYQKSVFITPFPCEKEIDFVGEAFGVRENIRIVTASNIEDAERFKKLFHLF